MTARRDRVLGDTVSKQKNYRRIKPKNAPFGTVPPGFAERLNRTEADPGGTRAERRRAKKLGIEAPRSHGTSGGVELTDEVIDELAAEAEAGYEEWQLNVCESVQRTADEWRDRYQLPPSDDDYDITRLPGWDDLVDEEKWSGCVTRLSRASRCRAPGKATTAMTLRSDDR